MTISVAFSCARAAQALPVVLQRWRQQAWELLLGTSSLHQYSLKYFSEAVSSSVPQHVETGEGTPQQVLKCHLALQVLIDVHPLCRVNPFKSVCRPCCCMDAGRRR